MLPVLDDVQSRVLGSLIEKHLATPQHYPLTLNALVSACNQTSNRHPVLTLPEEAVLAAIDELRAAGLVRVVHQPGQRAPKYRHVVDEALGLHTEPVAVLAVLLLRGPQTVGEIRTRTDRLADFDSLADVEGALDWMNGRAEPLVRRLERQPGQKEPRVAHLLAGDPDEQSVEEHGSGGPAATISARVAELESTMAELRAEMAEVRAALGDLIA